MRAWTFGQVNTQLLGTAAPKNCQGRANAAATAAQYLSGIGIGGQAPLIDAIAVVLNHQLSRLAIDAN